MARIRSIHPAIWTDEDFAMLSMASRVLFFGIWTEADDHGIFEWKTVSLKMRIFPADKVDMDPLLEELVTFRKVERFSHEGREYGAVRNFCRFQRPKKPSYKHVLPSEFRTYVGLTESSSVPVPHQFGTGTENLSLMKEEGGKREKEKDAADAATDVSYYRRIREVLGDNAGGLGKQLLDAKGGNYALARAAIEQASTKGKGAREYVGAIIRGKPRPQADQMKFIDQLREKNRSAVVLATDVPGGIPGIE